MLHTLSLGGNALLLCAAPLALLGSVETQSNVAFDWAVLSMGARQVGVVNMRTGDMRRRVAEIWSQSAKWSFETRARTVASRLESVHASSERWWRNLVIARVGSTPVVAVKGVSGSTAPKLPGHAKLADGSSPEGCVYVITADKDAASEFGLSQIALAKHLIAAMQNAMEPQRIGRRSPGDLPPAERRAAKHEAAIQSKQAGDEAWSDGDVATAMDHYREALNLSPAYIAARLSLASALATAGDTAAARAQARQVLSDPSATEEQRRAASRILASAGK